MYKQPVIRRVELSKRTRKALRGIPDHIVRKLQQWIDDVNEAGLEEVRKRHGWHDEPLLGKRQGQRSIRLNKAYRAIYVVRNDGIEFVMIEEVSKHEY